MVEIAASFLDVKEEDFIKTIYDLETAGTDYFHIDVMDGKFVENDTIDIMRKYTEYIKQVSNTNLEVHLMVEDVEAFSKAYIDMGVNTIMFHQEACKNETETLRLISYMKQNGVHVGVSINPKTGVEKIYPYLPYIHRVLVMTVQAGKGGQEFIPEMLEKIKRLSTYIYENGYEVDIEVDGGINDKTAKMVADSGADILVSGSYIIKSGDYKKAIKNIRFDKHKQ